MVLGEKIYCLSPEGQLKIIFDDGNALAIQQVDEAFEKSYVSLEVAQKAASSTVPLVVSLCFAGPDQKTVYVGSYGRQIAYFRSPVAGYTTIE